MFVRWELIAAIIVFLLLQIPIREYIVDDAYIHLTFARNLSAGDGFSFNPNVPTNGVTAPLWTILLALFCLVFTSNPVIPKILSIVFGALTLPAIYRLGYTLGLKIQTAIIIAFIWAVNVWLVRWSASGMETSLAVLLLIIAIDAQVRRKPIAGLWFGLAILCRPESGILLVILILDYLKFKGWPHTLNSSGLALLILLPWIVYAKFTFGTIIPNPALVKSDFGLPVWNDLLYGIKRTVLIIGGAHGLEILIIGIVLLIILRYRITLSERTVWLGALLFVWAIFPTFIYLSRGVFISSRYLIVGLPPLLLGAFLAMEVLALRGVLHHWIVKRRLIFSVMVVMQLFLTIYITLPHVKAFIPTITALNRMAETLRQDTHENASVAVGDVGLIGYASKRYVLDLEGLVSPEIIPLRVGRHLDNLILTERYQQVLRTDFILDKAQDSYRLTKTFGNRYEVIQVEPIPGGLVDTAHEQWYYTLYKINYDSDTGSVNDSLR